MHGTTVLAHKLTQDFKAVAQEQQFADYGTSSEAVFHIEAFLKIDEYNEVQFNGLRNAVVVGML